MALAAIVVGYQYFPSEENEPELTAQPAAASPASAVVPSTATFDVRAYCAAKPNDPGPGEQDAASLPSEVRAANADFWRCAGGRVMVCYGGASGRACMQQVTVDPDHVAELERFCRSSPGSSVPYSIAGPGREWRCKGTMLVSEGSAAVDGYGYLASSWKYLDTGNIRQVIGPTDSPAIASNEVDQGEIIARSLHGRWYDGGPGCASISRGDIGRGIVVRMWYCEADEGSATAVAMDFDNTVSAFVHEESGLVLRPVGNKIQMLSKEGMRISFGDGVYLSEDSVTYARQ